MKHLQEQHCFELVAEHFVYMVYFPKEPIFELNFNLQNCLPILRTPLRLWESSIPTYLYVPFLLGEATKESTRIRGLSLW